VSGDFLLFAFMVGLVFSSILHGLGRLVDALRGTWLFHRRLLALEKRAAALQEELAHKRGES